MRANVINGQVAVGGGLGEYEFPQLPAPGDHISLPEMSGEIGHWKVLFVEHAPVAVARSQSARGEPLAMIFVEFLLHIDI
jgi:hypothetical protein